MKVLAEPRWPGATVVVAATGASLTPEVAETVRASGVPAIAVSDAWRLLPWAEVLHSADTAWWRHHNGCPEFAGERWTVRKETNSDELIERYGLKAIKERHGDRFSTTPSIVCSGENSGYQAANLAILFGAARVVLVGFNMQGTHFFGDHPAPLRNGNPLKFVGYFRNAAAKLPPGVEIINATPDSALDCFPIMSLDDALAGVPVPVPVVEIPEEPSPMKYAYIGEGMTCHAFGIDWEHGAPVEVTDAYALKKLATHAHFMAVPDAPVTEAVEPAPEPKKRRKS